MERFTISKSEKQSIFEIYRACRLCGAGGGYRMPIIQNIVDLEGSDVELRQKIQECLQLEVRQDDRMPPLICEVCVDKVNDFYEFLEMSRQTNTLTRTRLGLPLQTSRRGEPEPSDCILGVTEPVYIDDQAKKSRAGPKCSKKIKKEVETVKIKVEDNVPSPTPTTATESRSSSVSSRSSRTGKRAPTPPPRSTRTHPTKPTRKETFKHNQVVPEQKGEQEIVVKPKTISKKELNDLLQDAASLGDNSLLVPRQMKRRGETELLMPLVLPKKTKMTLKEPAKEPAPAPAPGPRRARPGPACKRALRATPDDKIPVPLRIPRLKLPVPPPPKEVLPPKLYDCSICNNQFKSPQGHANHMKSHVPTYTKPQNACNPCGKWFAGADEAGAHHRYHRSATFPYHCRRCFDDFRSLQLYNEHIDKGVCSAAELPDVRCERCWRQFPTQNLLRAHKCPGVDGRPGGKCSKCARTYATHKTLKKHEITCHQRRKRDLIADPEVLRRLKPMQVRIARCDDLLANAVGERYDVSAVKPNHGLDKLYVYPYISFKNVKAEPLCTNSMVAIHGPIKEECERDRFIHWDSEDSDSVISVQKVDSLSTLSIKKLFSRNMLGKIPRKRRRVKNDTFEFDQDMGNISSDINDIINSLGDDVGNDCVVRNMNEQLRISLNHIIGVPDDSLSSDRDLENENVVSNENNFEENDSTEKDSEIVHFFDSDSTKNNSEIVSNVNYVDNASTDNDSEIVRSENNGDNNNTENVSEIAGNENNVINSTENNSEIVRSDNNMDRNDSTENDSEILLNAGKIDNSNEYIKFSNEHLNDVLIKNGETNLTPNNVSCDDTKLNTQNTPDDQNCIIEEANVEISKKPYKYIETNNPDIQTVSSNKLDTENNGEKSELSRIQNETQNSEDTIKEESLQNSVENYSEVLAVNVEHQSSTVNGINEYENKINTEYDNDPEADHDCNKSESEKPDETNMLVQKESPIKHSIESLIKDTDRNPEKYINEVISNIENIIMKNPRTDDNNKSNERVNVETKELNEEIDDQKLMDAIDAQIGDTGKDGFENDKITLEDLLPSTERSMALDDLSPEDFNFDA